MAQAHQLPIPPAGLRPSAALGAALRAPALKKAAPVVGAAGILFAGYLTLIVVEYMGLGHKLFPLKVTRFPTLLAYGLFFVSLAKLRMSELWRYTPTKLFLLLIFLTCTSVIYAVVQTYAFQSIRVLVDYFGLYVVTLYVVDRPARIDRLCKVVALMVIALVAMNVDLLTSGSRDSMFRAAYFMIDGNDFAWALNVFLPMILFLALGKRPLTTRLLGLAGLGACVLGIVGTQSRGSALALGASMLFFWLMISKRKLLGLVLIGGLGIAALAVAPAQYMERMQTIATYQDDGSAQGRLRAWKAATQMALDYPLGVGAGNFNSAYGRFYIPADASGWGAAKWISAHSVYFRILGEYGFPGLILLLTLLVTNFREAFRLSRSIRASPQGSELSPLWPRMLTMSLVAYAVAGTFLGGVAYPHLFLLSGLFIGARRIIESGGAAVPATATAAPSRIAGTRGHRPIVPPIGPGRPPGSHSRGPIPGAPAHSR